MKAVRNTEAGITVIDVAEPEGPGVRIRVRAAGICGSDLSMTKLGPMPNTLGHEFAGVLDDGTAVAVLPASPCLRCERCRAGAHQQCAHVFDVACGITCDGGMADAVVVDPWCLAPLAHGVRVEDACLVEPIAVALHACNRGGIQAGTRVAVVGAGTIGLLAAAVARDLGADVAIVARHDAQHRAAEALGISLEPGRAYDVVVEAAGTASAFDDAVGLCARGGTVVLVSTTWEPVTVSFLRAQMHEVTIVPAFVYGEAHGVREFDTAAALLASHPEWAKALVTHRFPLAEARDAFRVAGDRAHGALKVVLEP